MLSIEEIRDFCLAKKGVSEGFPFDEDTLVFKVAGKLFLLLDLTSNPVSFNVKCNPEKAIELRSRYNSVTPGYHMNKKHWNTVICDGSASRSLLLSWISESYDLVVAGLPEKIKLTIHTR